MTEEMRLVDANKLLENAWDADTQCGFVQVVDVGDIENAPTVDAAVVVHGWWIEKHVPISWCEDDVDVFWECSVCGCQSAGETSYCPECGAKMDLGAA